MSLFENFPWTNLHQLNLGWLIEEVKKCYSPDNPPSAMVISVNGESGEVILYKDARVALPDITEEQWNIYRGSANKITGIEFNKDNPATRINGNQRFVIYDAGNPPPYPVLAVNGETGNVILYEEPYVVFPDVDGNNWGLERKLNEGSPDEVRVGIMFDDTGKAYLTNDEETKELLTREDIPTSSGVVSFNGQTGIVTVTGADLKTNPNTQNSINTDIVNLNNELDTTRGNVNNNTSVINSLAYIINGNQAAPARNIPANSYVFVINSTISGITDGVYKTVNSVASGTSFNGSDLNNTGLDIGIINALVNMIAAKQNTLAVIDLSSTISDIYSGLTLTEGFLYKYGNVCSISLVMQAGNNNVNIPAYAEIVKYSKDVKPIQNINGYAIINNTKTERVYVARYITNEKNYITCNHTITIPANGTLCISATWIAQ